MVKNLPAKAGDIKEVGLIPGSGRSPGGRHSNPFQYSCLKNPMDRGTWWATVHRITKSWTRLKRLIMHACILTYLPLCQFSKTIFSTCCVLSPLLDAECIAEVCLLFHIVSSFVKLHHQQDLLIFSLEGILLDSERFMTSI